MPWRPLGSSPTVEASRATLKPGTCGLGFGFLANRRRATTLPVCFRLLGSPQESKDEQHTSCTEDCLRVYRCPKCGGPMKIIERLSAAEIQLRSPPVVPAAAETTFSNTRTPRASVRRAVPRLAAGQIAFPRFSFHCTSLQQSSPQHTVPSAVLRGAAPVHLYGAPFHR